MKKFEVIVGIILPAVLLFCSCSNNGDAKKDIPLKGDKVVISLTTQEIDYADGTKLEGSQVARMYWDENDPVYVFDETKYLGTLYATIANESGSQAALNGEIDVPSGSFIYLLYSPAFDGVPEISDGTVKADFAFQNGETPFAAYSVVSFDQAVISDMMVTFTFATNAIAVNMYNLAKNTELTSVSLTGVSDICNMKLGSGEVACSGEKSSGVVRKDVSGTDFKTSPEGEAMVLLTVAPSVAETKRILRCASNQESFYDFGFFKNEMTSGKYFMTVCNMFRADASKALFSVSSTDKAYIAMGNLYWDGNTEEYKFESAQYNFRNFYGDPVGSAFLDGQITSTPSNTVGSFYWSPSASIARSERYSTDQSGVTTFFASRDDFKVSGSSEGYWRTMTKEQFNYLMNERNKLQRTGIPDDARFAYAVVNGVKGIMVFPDIFAWEESMGTAPVIFNASIGSQAEWSLVSYSKTQFMEMEAGGCRFLPAAGFRCITDNKLKVSHALENDTSYGYYWSSTKNSAGSYYLFFKGEEYYINEKPQNNGYQVRQIHVVETSEE